MIQYYEQDTQEILTQFNVDAQRGLTSEQAAARFQQDGPNELIEGSSISPWRIIWEQLTAFMVVILIIAAVISLLLGDEKDAIAIMMIVVLNAILGFSQEFRAERAMAALKQISTPTVRVRRDGRVQEIQATELVKEDIVLLEVGNLVPADGRLLESSNLRVQESALTGESEPVTKHTKPIPGANIPLGDRKNMVYMGTVVSYGRGTAVITNTGMNTELGNIAGMLQKVEREPTPLQRRLAQLGKGLAIAALGIVAVVFFLGLLRGEEFSLMFLTAISMAVAAVPEGLPAVVTIGLAIGAQRMLKRQALIRKLPAVETLGSVTVICSDKTGTLTENRMTVTILDVMGDSQRIDAMLDGNSPALDIDKVNSEKPSDRSLGILVKATVLCNDAALQSYPEMPGRFQAIGDPTEGALIVAGAQLGLLKNELDQRWPRVAEIPFTSERKLMTTVHQVMLGAEQTDAPWRHNPYVAFSKGAVDVLGRKCSQVWTGNEVTAISDEISARILAANDQLAKSGQRVLGVAFKQLTGLPSEEDESWEQEMVFVGLVGMMDPPRAEVKEAVATCLHAGIRPIMITGDHPLTAQHIARELGISQDSQVITGQQLADMSPAELKEVVETVSVYARVSPENKLKIVEALQDKGHIAAMTGDGVNDAPALKKADIGVAMGITGTDVSKEAADMVLLNDNFATIVDAVREGRVIYDNIRKFIKYTMTSNSGEIWVMLLAPFVGMPLPLLPLQILWINLVTDGLPGLALTVEPAERGIMNKPPRHPKENIFGQGMWQHVLWVGLLMGFISLGVGWWGWSGGRSDWQTMVFTTITLSQMGHALAIRSGKQSLFQAGLLSNKPLVAAVLFTFALQMMVIYIPFLQSIFKTVALGPVELLGCLLLSTAVFWGVEIEKWLRRRSSKQLSAA